MVHPVQPVSSFAQAGPPVGVACARLRAGATDGPSDRVPWLRLPRALVLESRRALPAVHFPPAVEDLSDPRTPSIVLSASQQRWRPWPVSLPRDGRGLPVRWWPSDLFPPPIPVLPPPPVLLQRIAPPTPLRISGGMVDVLA